MARPSIKGSAFKSVVQQVRTAVSEDAISREALAKRLEPGELDVVEGTIDLGAWYDVGLHDRLLEVLRDVRGMKDVQQIGQTSARLLAEAGVYQQMDYLNRMQYDQEGDPESRLKAYGRDLRRLTTLSAAILNFSRWAVVLDAQFEDRYAIEITDASAFRDIHLQVIESFMNAISGEPVWTFERPQPDRVLFRMTRGI